MNKGLKRVLAAAGSVILATLLVVAVSPVQASDVEQRIQALEQELDRLKSEQKTMKQEAVAAEKKMPIFFYRPGAGLTIAAADDKWEVQMGGRLLTYWTFWTKGSDGTSIPSRGTTNGVLQVRRFRPYMNLRVNDGFYDLRQKLDAVNGGSSGGGNFTAFDAEMYVHFEQINPWLPYLGFGASPSAILNPQEHNCSSQTCGRSENSFFANAASLTTGSVDRGVGLVWRKIPRLGPTRISFFNVWVGEDRVGTSSQFNQLSTSNITRDGRSFTGGLGVRPFDKAGGSLGRWLKGLELSFGTVIQKSPREATGFGAWNVRTDQTRANRTSMIRTASTGTTDVFYYYTPGIGWSWNWITIRAYGGFGTARICNDPGNNTCQTGDLVRGSSSRFLGEFWLWSPKKGLLAGNRREGGFMLSPMFMRMDVKQYGSTTLRSCGGCQRAHAIDTGIALWYFIPGVDFNLGVVWDHWRCASCNSDVADVVKGFVAGDSADWDTITLVSRFRF